MNYILITQILTIASLLMGILIIKTIATIIGESLSHKMTVNKVRKTILQKKIDILIKFGFSYNDISIMRPEQIDGAVEMVRQYVLSYEKNI